MNNINDVYDPLEDPEADRYYTTDYPLRRDRIRSVLAQILNNRTVQTPREVKLLNPPVKRERPGLTYIRDGTGEAETRMVWLDSQILFNPVFKYAIFKQINHVSWSLITKYSTEWYDRFPDAVRLGNFGLFNHGEADEDEDENYNSTLQLMQFGSDESLQRFKLTNEHCPMHLIVQPPPAKTKAIFDDDDLTQFRGWLRLFKNTDFNETEVKGIMANYTDFERMEIAFLGDVQALNSCYAAIGGSTYLAWVSHRLSKTHKEQQ